MDVFKEQIIKKQPDTRDKILQICITLGIVIFSAACLTAFLLLFPLNISIIALFAIPGGLWLGIQFLKGVSVKYEYILTNKELDVDKITGKRKRKRMITLNLANTESFDICGDLSALNADITVSAHDNTFTNMWSLTVNHDKHGKVILLFNPNDEFIIKLNGGLLPKVRNKRINQV